MSDSALKTGAYPGYTLAQLREWIASGDLTAIMHDKVSKEIERRERVAVGDVSAMTDGERLHRARNR